MSIKPILFNTDMVRRLLDGTKTVTRRVVKPQPLWRKQPIQQEGHPEYWANWDDKKFYKAPYRPGDILYVRETWCKDVGRYMYKASYSDSEKFYRDGKEVSIKWHPSIHMPREAARIFLRVTDVRVERLRDITEEQAQTEGLCKGWALTGRSTPACTAKQAFMWVWDMTIKPEDRALYGWMGNPWVWVIEFERISREESGA